MIEDDIVRGTDEIRRNRIEWRCHRIMSRDRMHYMQKLNVSCDTIDTNEYIKLNVTGS